MDWTARVNGVMDYVESHLHNDILEDEVGKIMACPYNVFANSFSQIAGISFSEYVRRRRLTMAAYDLQNTDKRILDVAIEYGYQSDDAFRVAFKNLHGVLPAEVRKSNPPLVYYCRLDFEIKIGGLKQMKYTIMDREAFEVVGIRRTTPYGGGTWAIVKSDGSNDYMCAVEYSGYFGSEFTVFKYPATTWLRFEARGKISDNVLGNVWRQINKEFLPSSRYHKGPLPTIEKYVLWNEVADECIVEILIPQ